MWVPIVDALAESTMDCRLLASSLEFDHCYRLTVDCVSHLQSNWENCQDFRLTSDLQSTVL